MTRSALRALVFLFAFVFLSASMVFGQANEGVTPNFAYNPMLSPVGANMNPIATTLQWVGDMLEVKVFATTRNCAPPYKVLAVLQVEREGEWTNVYNTPAPVPGGTLGSVILDFGGLNKSTNAKVTHRFQGLTPTRSYRLQVLGIHEGSGDAQCVVGTYNTDPAGKLLNDDRLSHYEIVLSANQAVGNLLMVSGQSRVTFYQEPYPGKVESVSRDYDGSSGLITFVRPPNFYPLYPVKVHILNFATGESRSFLLPIQ